MKICDIFYTKSNNVGRTPFISLEASKLLYGIAILMMVFHHCFCIPSRLGYNYIPVIVNFEIEARFAYIGKMCVAIYSFITGYALSKKALANNEMNVLKRIKKSIGISFRQAISFYSKFWTVCIIFLPIGVIFFNEKYTLTSFIRTVILGQGFNGEWWYVYQYLIYLSLFPFLDMICNLCVKSYKKTIPIILVTFVAAYIFFSIFASITVKKIIMWLYFTFISKYMLIFTLAYIIGYFNIFEWIDETVKFPPAVYLLIMLLSLLYRYCHVSRPDEYACDVYIAPIFIYSFIKLLEANFIKKHIKQILAFFGRYSTFIWLTHTYWIYYYFQKIILLPRYSIFIYLWSLFLSSFTAIVIDYMYSKFKKAIIKCNQIDALRTLLIK